MEEYHGGNLAGHFSGPRLYKTLACRWWWQHMYRDAMKHANNCPQCAIVEGTRRKQKPPLTPIPTQHPFQVIGVDIMELPLTTKGNRYLIVFQDLFTKWPMAYPAPTNISDYREELTLSLSFARTTAMKTSQESQRQYKGQYDKTAVKSKLQIGDWVLVYFPHDETGKMRKLSQPWHGPYRVISKNDTDVTVMKIYFPDDPQIQVHLSRVQPCPPSFPRSFYWYGGKRTGSKID